jgi:hypothetical protein
VAVNCCVPDSVTDTVLGEMPNANTVTGTLALFEAPLPALALTV